MYTLYSKRIKNASGEPEVYVYDAFSQTFRNQFFYVIEELFDYLENNGLSDVWSYIHDSFAREIGVKSLGSPHYSKKTQIEQFVAKSGDTDFLDFLDYAFSRIAQTRDISLAYVSADDVNKQITSAFVEMNFRFKQNNLGYAFVKDVLIRKDNEHLHRNTIKPALRLLYENGFEGAEQEFLDAFEHHRKGENKDAILDALKAFESTMKAICDGMGYAYDPARSTAKDLIGILESNAFYPAYMNNHITSLRTSLESGLPTMRNKNAGHGQGAAVVNVSDEFAEYALNLAATNIVLLTKIYAAKKAGGT